MTSPSKLGLKTLFHDIPKPHIFETFDPAEDYEYFQRHIILPIIRNSHDNQSIHYTQKPTLPPPIVTNNSKLSHHMTNRGFTGREAF